MPEWEIIVRMETDEEDESKAKDDVLEQMGYVSNWSFSDIWDIRKV